MKLEEHTSARSQSQPSTGAPPSCHRGRLLTCSSGLLLFKRSSMLPYTQYLDDCANSLATDPQYASDPTLVHLIRSLRIAEETTYTFDHGSKEKIGELSDEKIQLLVRALSKQTEDWRASLPQGMFSIGMCPPLVLFHRPPTHPRRGIRSNPTCILQQQRVYARGRSLRPSPRTNALGDSSFNPL